MKAVADAISMTSTALHRHFEKKHMLVSAYFSALIQPIEHGYDKADAKRYLKTMVDFFTPGWRIITGLLAGRAHTLFQNTTITRLGHTRPIFAFNTQMGL